MKKQHESMLYKPAIDAYINKGSFKFGPLTSGKLRSDPQYVLFQMSRYKHACKILYGKRTCIDIGPGDGVGLPLLAQHFDNVLALDVDEYLLSEAKQNCEIEHVNFLNHNFFLSPLSDLFECAVCFDVLSSIPPENERHFIHNIAQSLTSDGCLVVGSQNKLATRFSNKENLVDQPNFKTFDELYDFLKLEFQNVIILSMHDETVHTGKRETAQYFIGIGIGVKTGSN